MSVFLTASIDVPSKHESKRNDLYAALTKAKYTKIPKLTTLWQRPLPENAPWEKTIEAAEAEIHGLARDLNIDGMQLALTISGPLILSITQPKASQVDFLGISKNPLHLLVEDMIEPKFKRN